MNDGCGGERLLTGEVSGCLNFLEGAGHYSCRGAALAFSVFRALGDRSLRGFA